jgi:hypothetical protein
VVVLYPGHRHQQHADARHYHSAQSIHVHDHGFCPVYTHSHDQRALEKGDKTLPLFTGNGILQQLLHAFHKDNGIFQRNLLVQFLQRSVEPSQNINQSL